MKIVILPGDGIGPEVVGETLKVLEALSIRDLKTQVTEIGRTAYCNVGSLLPDETVEAVSSCDAVLLGAVGSNVVGDEDNLKPEKALLRLRKILNCFVNLRPIKYHKSTKLSDNKTVSRDSDIIIVRELNSGVYFGVPRGIRRFYLNGMSNLTEGFSTSRYSNSEVENITRIAFEIARKRRKRVLLVDKANVLETSMVWREVTNGVSKDYRDIKFQNCYVDSASLAILKNTGDYDVVLTENLFGDILSDHLSLLSGSIGMLPSASLGLSNTGLYEPVHGSAPSLTGKNLANPIASILSLALMLRYSLGLPKEALLVEKAVTKILRRGYKTIDITTSKDYVGTSEIGDIVISQLTII